MNWAANLFGVIAQRLGWEVDADFIPDGKNRTRKIRGQNAHWLGLHNRTTQKYAYEYCYPVAAVVDTLADYDLTGVRHIVSTKGKNKAADSNNTWANAMNKLLDQPNPLQSWEQFRGQQVVYKRVFGFCPVLPLIPAGFEGQPWEATLAINIPPWCIEPVINPNASVLSSKVDDFVERYDITILGERFSVKPSQLFFLEDGFMKDETTHFIFPKSKLVGLDMAVSNICAAMEADNVLLRKRGALGFISHDAAATKDSVTGYIPMTVKQKKNAQKALNQYGISWDQFQYAITRIPLKWVQTALDVKALGTKETLVACEKAICHRYRFPYVLYEETDTTYANGDNAAATVYQTNVIPNANKDMGKYNKFFQADKHGVKLTIDFSDVAALQEDKKFAADAAQALDEALQIEYDANLITKNQWLEQRGYDTLSDGNVYKTEGDDPLAVKLGVGGTEKLMETITNTALDPETKKNTLIVVFGLDEATASKLVSKPTEPAQQSTNPPQPQTKASNPEMKAA